MNVDEIKKIKVARIKTQKSLMFFTRYFFVKRQLRKFVINEHHQKIIDALENVAKGNIKRLIINIAPRYGKTELAVKNFIAWSICNNAKAKFIHLSYSDDLALDNSEDIRDLITDQNFKQLFPEISLKIDSKSKKKWYTGQGGGVYATSASGQVTGFGAGQVDEELNNEILEISESKFGGAIIIDDPIKPDDVNTIIKDRVNLKFETTIRNRVNSRNTPIIIIMQRLDEDDLCGYLQKVEPDIWTVLSFPVIKEDGEALWPFKHTIEELNKLKEINTHVFSTQYMQNPQNINGLLIRKDEIRFADLSNIPEENIVFKFAVGDPADKGGDKFSMPFIHVAIFENTMVCYVKDVIHSTIGIEANTERVLDKIKINTVEQLFYESNGVGLAAILLIKKRLNVHQKLTAFPAVESKEVRIYSHYEFVKKYFVFDEKYMENSEYRLFINDLTSYTKEGDNNHKKDAIDVLCSAANIIKIKYNKFLYC